MPSQARKLHVAEIRRDRPGPPDNIHRQDQEDRSSVVSHMSRFVYPAGGPEEVDVRQRITEGRQQFLGLELLCGEGALVPRAETELLGLTGIDKIKGAPSPVHVIDLCCGVGNLACAVA